MKQMGLGIMQYTQDYDELYPRAIQVDLATPPDGVRWVSGDYWVWQQMIQPYVKSYQIFTCPSSSYTAYPPRYLNYSANRGVMNYYNSGSPVSMAAIQEVATTYLVLEGGDYMLERARLTTSAPANYFYVPGSSRLTTAGCAGVTANNNARADCEKGRHFDGNNILFADGHVKWLRETVIYQAAQSGTAPTPWLP